MLKTNLIKILSTLDKAEFKKFGKFLNSPYFNTNKKVTELYAILKKYYPEFEDLAISNENIYRKLYQQDKVVMGTMYFLISEMESLLEKFIGLEDLNPVTLDLHFLEAMNRSNLQNAYAIKYKEIQKKIRDNDDSRDHIDANGMNSLILSRIHMSHKKKEYDYLTKKDSFKKEWIDPISEVTKLFLRYIVKDLQTLLNLKTTISEKLSIPLLDEMVRYLEENERYKEDPEIEIYYYQIRMFMGFEDKYYKKLKKVLDEDHLSISNYLFNETIITLQNYCVNRVTRGVDMVKEEFELIKLRLKHMPPKQKEQFPIDVFYQSFMMGVAVDEFEWADKFFKDNIRRIDPRFQNNASNYCSARISFHNGEYDKALKYLSEIGAYAFIHIKPAVKILQLMIYYELKLFAEAEDAANSFMQFLRNDKFLATGTKKTYVNFLKNYLKIMKVENNTQIAKVYDLRLFINSQKEYVVAGKWFHQKLDELEFKVSKKKKPAVG